MRQVNNARFNVTIEGRDNNDIYELSPVEASEYAEITMSVKNSYYLDYEKIAYRRRQITVSTGLCYVRYA